MKKISIMLMLAVALFTGCEGPDGPIGPVGPTGDTGSTGPMGAAGANGTDGTDGADGADGTLEFYFADFEEATIPSEFDQSTTDNGDWVLYTYDNSPSTVSIDVLNGVIGNQVINDGQVSRISIPFTSNLPTIVEFDAGINSEKDFDYLVWAVNDVYINGISGEGGRDMYHFTFEVPAGSNTLIFQYQKDEFVSTGSDIGWIDNLMITNITSAGRYDISLPVLPDGVSYYK